MRATKEHIQDRKHTRGAICYSRLDRIHLAAWVFYGISPNRSRPVLSDVQPPFKGIAGRVRYAGRTTCRTAIKRDLRCGQHRYRKSINGVPEHRLLSLSMLSSTILHARDVLANISFYDGLYGLFALLTIVVLLDYAWMLRLHVKMPPGPLPLPIVGNTFLLPDVKPWFYFEELSKKYNAPMITFWIGRNPTVWLNDAWAANELLDKRAGIYSSRPRMVVFGDLGTGDWNLVTMKYGERWFVVSVWSI